MKLHIIRKTESSRPSRRQTARIPRAFLRAWVKRSAQELKKEKVRNHSLLAADLTLVFVSVKDMQALNHEFRGKKYATDVLSFAPSEPGSIGELVLCQEVLRRQAREHKHSFREELGYMVLHGLLHLMGYEHEKSAAQAKAMFDIQDRVFERMLSR